MGRAKGWRHPQTQGREDDLRALLARGVNNKEAASLLGLSKDGLYIWCKRHGCLDIYYKFPRNERKREPKEKWGGAW